MNINIEFDSDIDLYNMLLHEYERIEEHEPAFYYHSDHLGSSAYLTDDSGQLTQILNYLPYGEDWVDIQINLDPSLGQYTFNGKEKDRESGFHYYGARYYWSEVLTMWLSVDPMADKYPGISPYTYCAWNPIKLVDSDGREWDPASLEIINKFRKDTEYARDNATTEKQRKELQAALDELDILSKPGGQMYHIEYGITSNYDRNGETDYDIENDRVRIIIAYDGGTGDIAHELKHAYQFEIGDLSFNSQTGGCAMAVLYDLTDEESAYRRGSAYGVPIPKNLAWNEKFPIIHNSTGESGFYYPFLLSGDIKPPHMAGGKIYPASSRDIHGRSTSTNNIYRYEGKTYFN